MNFSYLVILLSISVTVHGTRFIKHKSLRSDVSANGSKGCGTKTDLALGVPHVLNLNVKDSNFEFSRTYQINLPPKYDANKPSEILFYFHGQGGQWPWPGWDSLANEQNFITIQPLGLSENTDVKAWQTGLADQDLHFANSTCYPATIGTCYDTCKKLNMCSPCQWSSCVDDGLFIQKLMHKIKHEFCIDNDNVWANGPSNGGMFTYYLTGRFPDMFTKVVPIYGQPLYGNLRVPDDLAYVDIMHIHDRSDRTVPQHGVSEDGWIFHSVETTLETWARQKDCPVQFGFAPVRTPYDGGKLEIKCYNKYECSGNVFLCWWDGEHGSWADETELLALWFFRMK